MTSSSADNGESISVSSSDEDCSSSVESQNSSELSEQIRKLQVEIQSRQKLLAELLRRKEETETSNVSSTSQSQPSQDVCLNYNGQSTFHVAQYFFCWEVSFAFPAYIAMMANCLIYIITYRWVHEIMSWTLNQVVIYLTRRNDVERITGVASIQCFFYTLCLLLSCLIQRISGTVYEWNQAKYYQKRLKTELRNRWRLKCWDVVLCDWLSGCRISEKNQQDIIDNDKSQVAYKNKLRPYVKFILDIISFWVSYWCVDSLLHAGVMYLQGRDHFGVYLLTAAKWLMNRHSNVCYSNQTEKHYPEDCSPFKEWSNSSGFPVTNLTTEFVIHSAVLILSIAILFCLGSPFLAF